LGKAIRRIFASAVINLFFLPRLDRSLFIQGFDKLDTGTHTCRKYIHNYIHDLHYAYLAGYMAYLSAVRVDAAYNNPVMNVFVYLLSQEKISNKTAGITI